MSEQEQQIDPIANELEPKLENDNVIQELRDAIMGIQKYLSIMESHLDVASDYQIGYKDGYEKAKQSMIAYMEGANG